jgi:hypothetical protein
MLRNSIRKPGIYATEDHILQYGFHNLIDIFEKLNADLYDWISIEFDQNAITSMIAARTNLRELYLQRSFSRPNPIRSVAGIMNLDAAVKQKWLQIMASKLSISDLSQFRNSDALLPFHFPIFVAKAVMDVYQGSTTLRCFNVSNSCLL